VAVGLTESTISRSNFPRLAPRLWLELDIVPFIFYTKGDSYEERANSVARKVCFYLLNAFWLLVNWNMFAKFLPCQLLIFFFIACHFISKVIMYFGPMHVPRISVGFRNEVEVDANRVWLCDPDDYRRHFHPSTWAALKKLAHYFRERNLSMSFFNAT
jgi:hypothetical protein